LYRLSGAGCGGGCFQGGGRTQLLYNYLSFFLIPQEGLYLGAGLGRFHGPFFVDLGDLGHDVFISNGERFGYVSDLSVIDPADQGAVGSQTGDGEFRRLDIGGQQFLVIVLLDSLIESFWIAVLAGKLVGDTGNPLISLGALFDLF
jgi:hypothetical protein